MIAFKDDLPLVQFPEGKTVAFERAWLIRSLTLAAHEAGYAKWWLAEHVTESVAAYLQREYDENIVSTSNLTKAVKSVLQVIGYSDVANTFKPMPPPERVSLIKIAQEAGFGYELAFFEILKDRLREMLQSGTDTIELEGLSECVKQLRSAKNWRQDCNGLRNEIVGFVRGEVTSSSGESAVQIQMS